MKDKIAKWYKQGFWPLAMVRAAADKGIITPEDFAEITGEEW